MIVQRVHLAEGGAHLAHSQLKASRQGGEGEEAFFQVDAVLAKADEEVGAGVGIQNGLESHLAFVHFKRGRAMLRAISGSAQEVANDGDVGIKNLGGGSARTT